jgi:hypothetical protein
MNASIAKGGDSGGPIYCGMNITTNGKATSYEALVLGMTFGEGTLNNEPVTYFVPFREIQNKFNVTLLTN